MNSVDQTVAAPSRSRFKTYQVAAWAVALGLLVFLAWAALAPLAQGVPADGFVVVEGNRKTIQHLSGGVVDKIWVKQGQIVKEGDPLIELSATQAQALQMQTESQMAAVLAIEARLVAERSGAPAVLRPALFDKNPAAYEHLLKVQQQLFATRRATLKGEEDIYAQTVSGLRSQIMGLRSQEQGRAEQLRLFREEQESIKPLVNEGFVPKSRLLEIERAIALVQGQRGEDIASIARAETAITEARYRLLQSKSQYQKEVETQLTDIQRQVSDYRERLVAAQDELSRVVIRSPVAGTVVDLIVNTLGGVVSPGQKLMDIVPSGKKLVLEAKIPTHLVDNLRLGLECDVHFLALDQMRAPVVVGRLSYLSADRSTDPRTDMSYFVGQVEIDADQLVGVAAKAMQPGVPVSVLIKTDERSMLSYLLRPLLVRLHSGMKER